MPGPRGPSPGDRVCANPDLVRLGLMGRDWYVRTVKSYDVEVSAATSCKEQKLSRKTDNPERHSSARHLTATAERLLVFMANVLGKISEKVHNGGRSQSVILCGLICRSDRGTLILAADPCYWGWTCLNRPLPHLGRTGLCADGSIREELTNLHIRVCSAYQESTRYTNLCLHLSLQCHLASCIFRFRLLPMSGSPACVNHPKAPLATGTEPMWRIASRILPACHWKLTILA